MSSMHSRREFLATLSSVGATPSRPSACCARCTAQPEWTAQRIVDGGFSKRYDFALQAIKDLPYARWRDYDAEDTIRYYALRLHEAKMVPPLSMSSRH